MHWLPSQCIQTLHLVTYIDELIYHCLIIIIPHSPEHASDDGCFPLSDVIHDDARIGRKFIVVVEPADAAEGRPELAGERVSELVRLHVEKIENGSKLC